MQVVIDLHGRSSGNAIKLFDDSRHAVQLHSEAFDFDLIVTSAKSFQRPVFSPANNIVGVEHHGAWNMLDGSLAQRAGNLPIIPELIKLVSFRSQLGQVDVALGYTCSAYPCRSLCAQWHRVFGFVQNVTRGVG
jgi:hypothetical protein